MKHTEKHYGVLLGRKTSHPFLAMGNDSGPRVFFRRHAALVFRDELAAFPHRLKGRVIPVTVSYEVV